MNKNYLIAGAAVLGAGAGFYGGYRWAFKKFYASYDEILGEEIRKAKLFYAKANKAGQFSTPEGAAEALGVVGEAADALLEYQGKAVEPDHVVLTPDKVIVVEEPLETFAEQHQRLIEENIFDKPPFISTPRDDAPYVISLEEWLEQEGEHDQISVTWYEGDRVMADERDEPVETVELLFGFENLECFGLGSEDDNVVLIRNKLTKTDFEVSRSTGKYAHEVLGLEHSDETFSKRTPRRQWDD